MIDGSFDDLENRIAQQVTTKDFGVFPSAEMVGARVTTDQMREAGEKANAYLVVFATATDRLKNKKEDFLLYEGEATVQIYSRVSGELLVTKPVRASGRRTSDEVEAKRSAREDAVDDAANDAIERTLAKAHKILVHQPSIITIST